LQIQEGYSMAYAPKTMMAWVSSSPTSQHINNEALHLRYRFHSAMTGSLGLGEDLTRYTEEQIAEAATLVAEYKTLRHIVQEGLLYRLNSPRTGDLAAVQYISRDQRESVVFVFLHSQHYWRAAPRVYPRGLDPAGYYRIEGIIGEEAKTVSGQSLMRVGLQSNLDGHFGSALIKLTLD
jgi:alpha-galactosidase